VLATTGLASLTRYTVEMIFSFDQTAYYRRVLDVENRESDSGLYVNPDNQVELYYNDNTIAVGTTQLGTGFHHLLFVVDDGTVRVYVDGVRQFAVATTGMSLDNANNPQRLINLFVDNAASGGASDEYSDGRIALCRLFDAALTDVEAVQLFQEANGLPSLAVSLNDTALVTGETLGIRAVTASGPTQALVDLYVILQVPGDIFASVIGGGGLVLGAVPLASSLAPVAADVEVFAHTFTGDEPSGTYVVYAAITEPGMLNVLGVVQLATFSFSP
jgi:hypothetical protein